MQQRRGVVRIVLEQRGEFGDRVRLLAEQGVHAAQLPPRLTVLRFEAQPLLELRHAAVIVAGVEVRDLEIALGDLHFLVELQRLHERVDRFLVQSFVVVQNAEVVVRPGVRRIDAPGEGAKNVAVALGDQHGER